MSDPALAHWFERLEAEGSIVAGDDGFYVYWPDSGNNGALDVYGLRALADYLDEKNEPWQKQIDSDPRIGPL